MNVVIRQMRLDRTEVEAVAAMRHEAFFAGTSRTVADEAEGLEALVGDTSGEAFVAESEGAVAGSCLLVERELDQLHEVGPWLAGLVVAPAMRGMGIGAALVKAVETEAAGRGLTRLYLYTDEAEGFYATLHWSVVDRFQDEDGNPGVLMARDFT